MTSDGSLFFKPLLPYPTPWKLFFADPNLSGQSIQFKQQLSWIWGILHQEGERNLVNARNSMGLTPIGKKTPSRPGPPVALVTSAALDNTAPLRNPSGLMVCAPLWGIPSDAWPAVLVLVMLQPLVLVYQSHYLLPDALLSQHLLPDISLPSPRTATFPGTAACLSSHSLRGRLMDAP